MARERKPIIEASETHDFTRRGWGHDYFIQQVFDHGERLKVGGWKQGIAKGDYLILVDARDGNTRYRVEEIRYTGSPKDMWFATLRFTPRGKRPHG